MITRVIHHYITVFEFKDDAFLFGIIIRAVICSCTHCPVCRACCFRALL